MSIRRLLLLLCLAFNLSPSYGFAVKDSCYLKAFEEITDMLDRKTELNLKRAVFLPEWAYHGGKLNYEVYCATIESLGKTLTDFMVLNGLDKHPIGGNIALFEYFTNPCPLNDYKAYDYDFEDFRGEEDQTKTFVTKLMITHSGQCRSLPLLYKILCARFFEFVRIVRERQFHFGYHAAQP